VFRPINNPDESPIFVLGTGRSGTTLLRQMLDAHPRIHMTHEAAFYFYLSLAPQNVSMRVWLERYFDTFSFKWLRIAPQKILDELPGSLPRTKDVEAIRAIMRSKAKERGKPRYGEKNPLDTMSLARIFTDFPDARVIYIVRDYKATIQSLHRMPWAPESILLNSLFCRLQLYQIQPYLDRIFEVRLEDLVSEPRTTMRSILNFVGEPWDESVLDHVQHASRADVAPLPWFNTATQEALSPVTNTARDGSLSPAALRLLEGINHAGMMRYGYEAVKLDQEPPLLELVRLVLRELPHIGRVARKLWWYHGRLKRHMKGLERFVPEEAFSASLSLNPEAWRFYPGFLVPRII
jgi:hypothetical protein